MGIATALGLSRGTGARLCGVPSLEALAYAELSPGEQGAVLLDARSNELYFAHYRRRDDDVEEIAAPRVARPGELDQILPDDIPIFGDTTVADAAALDESRRKTTANRSDPARGSAARARAGSTGARGRDASRRRRTALPAAFRGARSFALTKLPRPAEADRGMENELDRYESSHYEGARTASERVDRVVRRSGLQVVGTQRAAVVGFGPSLCLRDDAAHGFVESDVEVAPKRLIPAAFFVRLLLMIRSPAPAFLRRVVFFRVAFFLVAFLRAFLAMMSFTFSLSGDGVGSQCRYVDLRDP